MVIDTSVLVAILYNEPETERFADAISRDPIRLVSAASVLEATMVVQSELGEAGWDDLDALLARSGIEIVAFTAEQLEIAREAFRRYGKGRHPAGLNFGDCFSYALARHAGEKLLFKGDDFARTDMEPA
jgi:ribonuclease VapC